MEAAPATTVRTIKMPPNLEEAAIAAFERENGRTACPSTVIRWALAVVAGVDAEPYTRDLPRGLSYGHLPRLTA